MATPPASAIGLPLRDKVTAGPAVVKEDVNVVDRALPAKSLTPELPPTTLTVYVFDKANAELGVIVATRVDVL
jgi:hypothetical protein